MCDDLLKRLYDVRVSDMSIILLLFLSFIVALYIARRAFEFVYPYNTLADFPVFYEDLRIRGRVTNVEEGDRFTFEHIPDLNRFIRGSPLRARLAGITAPSSTFKEPFGEESKLLLSYYIMNRDVRMEVFGFDQTNRLVVVAYYRDTTVNYELLKAGLASLYRESGTTHHKHLYSLAYAQRLAQKCKFGIWKLKSPKRQHGAREPRHLNRRLFREPQEDKESAPRSWNI